MSHPHAPSIRSRSSPKLTSATLLLAVASVMAASLAVAPFAAAQGLPHMWSRSFGDSQRDFGFGLTTDPCGNIIMTGSFEGSVDFGGGSLISTGGRDVYIAKFDPAGAHLWSASFGDLETQHSTSVTTDDAGNILITGYYHNRIDFGGIPLVSAGGWDIFVAKFTADGAHLWSYSYGDYADDWGMAIDCDASGDVYIYGYFQGAVDFGGGPLPTAGNWDVYLARLEGAAGGHVWSQRFGDPSEQVAGGMDVNGAGRIAICGYFSGVVDFGGGPLTGHAEDAFVAVYDALGAHLWSRGAGDYSPQHGIDVAIDAAGNVAFTGEFEGSLDLGGGALVCGGGAADVFLARYDAAGAHRWSRSSGDAEYQFPAAVAMELLGGDVILVGSAAGTLDLGGGPLTTQGNYDVFVAAYDADGAHLVSRLAGDAESEYSGNVTLDASGCALHCGHFRGTIDLGGGPLNSVGDWDIFLGKYGPATQGAGGEAVWVPLTLVAHPNPCRTSTSLTYALPHAGPVTLRVFDAQGRLLETLLSARQPGGVHRLNWSPSTGAAESGTVRFVSLGLGRDRRTTKVILLP